MSLLPGRLSLLSASLIALSVWIVIALLLYFTGNSEYVLYSFPLALVIFFSGFLIINFVLDHFFYNNTRQIYRNILQLKSKTSSVIPKRISNERIFSEINRVLIDWEKENEDEIVHLKEMETFRKEFLGNVSHELKTPIFTIQGYIHTLMDGGIEDHDINMLYLGKAAKSIDRLISIVDDLEAISRLEAGELIVERRTFEINDLIQDVIESLDIRAREGNVTLELEQGTTNKNYVYADKEMIRQVLVNLLVNSIKYGKKNGKSMVAVEDQGDYLTVSVSDNGIGIEKHHLGRLFERFYRIDKSRSREAGGTGLGLAIVKHILEAHNEKISVDSKPGTGTTFTFTLRKSQ